MSSTSRIIAGIWLIPSVVVAGITAVVIYVVSLSLTTRLIVNLALVALVFVLVCYGSIRLVARQLGLSRAVSLSMSVVIAFLLILLVVWPAVAEYLRSYPDNASEEVLQALRANTLPLATVRAGSGFDDLQPLQSMLQDKRIVALGEASHGTSEFFQMKHRLLEFLVREMGFQHFGMELSPADGEIINAYIAGESSDPRQVLYWPWATTEVMDMFDWMLAYNADPASPHKLTFHGIDPRTGERDAEMAENVTRILEQAGPDSKIVLWAHNGHISNAPERMGHALKQRWGTQAYLLGFEFNYGAFTSRMLTINVFRTEPASPAYYAYALGQLEAPILFLDFQTMSQDAGLEAWLATPQRSHDLQELHAIFRLKPDWYTINTSWLELYDGLIYIEESTPANSLP